jgi:hypothetical protein
VVEDEGGGRRGFRFGKKGENEMRGKTKMSRKELGSGFCFNFFG